MMDRDTFLHALWDRLVGRMPPQEVDAVMRHYAKQFDEAGVEREEEIAQMLGDPAALGDRLAEDWAQKSNMPVPRKGRGTGTKLLMIFLGICFGFPLALCAVALVCGVLVGTLICLAVGIVCVLGGFSVLFAKGLFTAMFFMGGGFLAGGIGLLMGAGALLVGKLCFGLLRTIFKGGERA